ncbi:ZIP zinc/iron transport family [Aureobasidium pullulans]|uniref:ZIP zinc/iron transport family n=1 Tax=Aureobasidium pullulans TaxID=5580 RepID=A0A4S9KKV1_AURPU|nr:ZIP zinc/iron transport family [Aureobasidium pullulans]
MSTFDPTNIDLTTASPRDIICYLQLGKNEYNGHLPARISAVFVMLVVSTLGTAFPYIGKQFPRVRIPTVVYLFARYFGSGVIVSTAFIHLLDPAYQNIGPNSCVGMTGNWAMYSWTPAIMLASCMCIFVVDVVAQKYVADKYGLDLHTDVEGIITGSSPSTTTMSSETRQKTDEEKALDTQKAEKVAFAQQFAAFLILEFGIIWHSIFIGLNFGVAGSEWSTLYIVLMFHQGFEGLGIGARMSMIPFPAKYRNWLPWLCIAGYGVTTPISMAVGLGLRTTYNSGSYESLLIVGVFDAISAGILVYNGLVELLARDFLFEPQTRSNRRLTFMMVCVFLRAMLMCIVGEWA